VPISHFRGDRDAAVKPLLKDIQPFLNDNFIFEKFGSEVSILLNPNKSHQIRQRQCGVVRVNCLDCIDRTNAIQTYIGVELLAV
jgi:hypothetical protein